MVTTVPWVGIDAKNCLPKSKLQPCDSFTLSGTHTVMTDKSGVSSLTVDATLGWEKTVIDPPDKKQKPIFRDFGKDMEFGWNFLVEGGSFNMEQVSQKYWARGWPDRRYNPAPASLKKP